MSKHDQNSSSARIPLEDGWLIRSSAEVGRDGKSISSRDYRTAGWHPAEVPGTVLGALVKAGVYPDPFKGQNLLEIPGNGPRAKNFSGFDMPPDSPFRVPFWYRRDFSLPDQTESCVLELDGVNYRASVWLNGRQIASADDLRGSYRSFRLDLSELVDRKTTNSLALEVSAPEPDDLALTWVDWNPCPPDKNMGLWRDARLSLGGAVMLRDPQVLTRLEQSSIRAGAETAGARLSVSVDVCNLTDQPQSGRLMLELGRTLNADGRSPRESTDLRRGDLEARSATLDVALEPHEIRRVELDADRFEALVLESARLWWPRQLGPRALYDLCLAFVLGARVSDELGVRFGVREVKSELTSEDRLLFRVNGEPLLIRGAGWASDLLHRPNASREAAELDYVIDLGLNTIRFEGMLARSDFLERCDREGILVIAGWCCGDKWEKWESWQKEHHETALESLRCQVRRVRNHPSLIAWWYGSDFAPPPDVEARYLEVFFDERWPNAKSSSAANKPTELSGASGVKMNGPYDWVPPNYWLCDRERGGAFGFATEICPGPAIPPLESIQAMLGAEPVWPIDETWNFHAGLAEFANVEIFTRALEARYGPARGALDYTKKAQLMTYEAERAMFEAYARSKYRATGVIHWMLNNAWPSLIWHLYDWYLRPGGGYFGAKKACEPVHALYAYDDRSVWVTSELRQTLPGLELVARLLSVDSRELWRRSMTLEVPADGVVRAFEIPELGDQPGAYFLDLRLRDARGAALSTNFYWLSTQPDVLDFDQANWFVTPVSSYADFKALAALRASDVVTSFVHHSERHARVSLKNPGSMLAFFLRLRLLETPQGSEILPVLWEDNFITLLPGEERVVSLELKGRSLPESAVLELSGQNLEPRCVAPSKKHPRKGDKKPAAQDASEA